MAAREPACRPWWLLPQLQSAVSRRTRLRKPGSSTDCGCPGSGFAPRHSVREAPACGLPRRKPDHLTEADGSRPPDTRVGGTRAREAGTSPRVGSVPVLQHRLARLAHSSRQQVSLSAPHQQVRRVFEFPLYECPSRWPVPIVRGPGRPVLAHMPLTPSLLPNSPFLRLRPTTSSPSERPLGAGDRKALTRFGAHDETNTTTICCTPV